MILPPSRAEHQPTRPPVGSTKTLTATDLKETRQTRRSLSLFDETAESKEGRRPHTNGGIAHASKAWHGRC